MRKACLFTVWLLVLSLTCGAVLAEGARPGIRYEGDGFDTPEEAVTYYLEGLKSLDLEQMLGAFAWETQAAHYSAEKYTARIRVYMPSANTRMPASNEFMTSMNLHALRSAQIGLIYRSVETFILGDDSPNGLVISLPDEEAVSAFYRKFDNGRLETLSSMTDIRFLDPDEVTGGHYSSPGNQKTAAAMTAIYGADELTEVPVLADVGGEYFFCSPLAARYGDKWYLVSATGNVVAILGIDMDRQAFLVTDQLPFSK